MSLGTYRIALPCGNFWLQPFVGKAPPMIGDDSIAIACGGVH